MAVSNGFSLFRVMFQRIVTFPDDVHWKSPMDCQWHVPTDVHVCCNNIIMLIAFNYTNTHGNTHFNVNANNNGNN